MEETNKDKSVVVNIENYTGEQPVEVILRNGEAKRLPEPLPTLEPRKIRLKGSIETPANWLEKRSDKHDAKGIYAVMTGTECLSDLWQMNMTNGAGLS